MAITLTFRQKGDLEPFFDGKHAEDESGTEAKRARILPSLIPRCFEIHQRAASFSPRAASMVMTVAATGQNPKSVRPR